MEVIFRLPRPLYVEIRKLLRYGHSLGITYQQTTNQVVGLGLPYASAKLRADRQRGIAIPSRQPVGKKGEKLPQFSEDIEDRLIRKAEKLADEYGTSRGLVLCWACHLGWKPAGRWVERNGYNYRTLFRDNFEMNRLRYSRTPQKDKRPPPDPLNRRSR